MTFHRDYLKHTPRFTLENQAIVKTTLKEFISQSSEICRLLESTKP